MLGCMTQGCLCRKSDTFNILLPRGGGDDETFLPRYSRDSVVQHIDIDLNALHSDAISGKTLAKTWSNLTLFNNFFYNLAHFFLVTGRKQFWVGVTASRVRNPHQLRARTQKSSTFSANDWPKAMSVIDCFKGSKMMSDICMLQRVPRLSFRAITPCLPSCTKNTSLGIDT